ncbi:MAG: prolipoprotein diacylglyceryl transferase [Desulfatiglandaceae bacterium]
MHPQLFSIGPFTLQTYGLFVALGFLLGLLVALKIGQQQGIVPQQVLDMGFIILFSAVLGSRLLYVLMNWSYYSQRPWGILEIWNGGLVFSGGAVCAIAAIVWYARHKNLALLKLADLWAPAAAIGQGFGRIGCLMAGCCYGKATRIPWAVTFTDPEALAPLHQALHPTEIYHAVSGFAIFGILLFLHKKKSYTGRVFIWYLLLHSFSRLLIERFRGDDRGMLFQTGMTVTQFVSTLILAGAFITIIILKSRWKKEEACGK